MALNESMCEVIEVHERAMKAPGGIIGVCDVRDKLAEEVSKTYCCKRICAQHMTWTKCVSKKVWRSREHGTQAM